MSKRGVAKRSRDGAMPPLYSLNQREQNFTLSIRKMLGSGWSLSFTKAGDEMRAVATIDNADIPELGGSALYGAGETINEALATLVLEYYIRRKK